MLRRFTAASLILLASSALAGDDHERARQALARGEIMPLTKILEIAERAVGGRVIDVEFEEEAGRFTYEIETFSAHGRLVKLSIDAKTGAILKPDEDD